MVDLNIKNCKLVTPRSILAAGVSVDNGKIVCVGSDENLPAADKTIDAKGNYVMPGAIDPHVHIQDEDLRTETQSAACGGVTTIMPMAMSIGASFKSTFPESKKMIEKNAMIDVAPHFIATEETHFKELEDYVKMGIPSIKVYTSYAGAMPICAADDGMLYVTLETLGRLGGLTKVHPENGGLVATFSKRSQLRDDLVAWSHSRPVFAEVESISRVIYLAKTAKAPIYVCHVSAGECLHPISQAKAEGVEVVAETTTAYLTLTNDCKRFKGLIQKYPSLARQNPPLRTEGDIEKLWWGIRVGLVDCIGTDHNGSNLKIRKEPIETSVWKTVNGFPGVETMLPIMLDEGVNKRGIPLEKVVEVCCYNTAIAHGMYPEKGTIEPGSDADLVIIDLKKRKKVSAETLHSHAGFTPWEGWEMTGWPILTMVRGKIVMENGQIVGKPGTGKFIFRKTRLAS